MLGDNSPRVISPLSFCAMLCTESLLFGTIFSEMSILQMSLENGDSVSLQEGKLAVLLTAQYRRLALTILGVAQV